MRTVFTILAACLIISSFAGPIQAQWVQTNGPYGAGRYVNALAISDTDLFAGTEDGGVFRSMNNGASWTASNNGLRATSVNAFVVSGTNLFAGTDSGVFLSTNNGTSWIAVNTGFAYVNNNITVYALAASGTYLYAGTSGGFYVSTNNGASWTWSGNTIDKSSFVEVYSIAVSGDIVFAGTGTGLYVSSDDGATWSRTDLMYDNSYVYAHAILVSGTDVFAGIDGGVFLSTDNGGTWTAVNTGLPAWTSVYALALSGTNLFAGTGNGVFLSTNNGTNWTAVNNGLAINTWVTAFAVSGTNIFAGTYGRGVFLSTNNGTSWAAVNTGLTSTYVNAFAVSGTNLFAGTSHRVFLSTDNGASWTSSGLAANVYALAVSGTNLFAGTGGNGVYLSTDNGTSWTQINNGLASIFVNALAAHGADLFAATAGASGVFLSTNKGTSWTAANTGLMTTYVNAFAVSGTNLFAGTLLGGVYLSTNNGTSWTAVNNGVLASSDVKAFAVSPNGTGDTNLFAGTQLDGVFLSTNNGTSWTAVNNGLTSTSVNALVVSGTNLFAGTEGGGVWRRPLSEMVAKVLSVDSATPSNGTVNVPLKANLSITFSAPLDTNVHLERGLPLLMYTNIDSVDSVRWSSNLTTLSAVAYLQPNTAYTVGIFGAYGQGGVSLHSPYILRFTTGSQFPSDSVGGMVTSGTTAIPADSAIVGLTMAPNLGHLTSIPPLVAVTVADSSGNFVLPDVPNGTYYPVAAKDVDGDGVINPLTGKDVIAVGTPIVVNNANVTGVVLRWTSFSPMGWKQALSISDSLLLSLPPHSEIRFVSGLGVDTSGNSLEWVTGVTNSVARSGFLVTAGAVSTILPMDSTIYDSLSAFTVFSPDSAANAGIFVSNVQNGGGRAFLQQYVSAGDSVYLLLYLGELKRTQFGLLAPDSGVYWGAQYVALNPKAMPPVTTIMFVGDFKTGAILVATGVKNGSQAIPKSYALEQNYPNPFNPTTKIEYQLPKNSHVTLKVYDILGREVQTLVDGAQKAGNYSVTFDGSRFASGVYFYRLAARGFVATKKLVLVK